MDVSRGHRRRRKKHVDYDDIVPSTDLPPLVEGELRCFLFVTLGDLVWGTTATHKVPPASPVYIRLRWWGEASNGTYFRPAVSKALKTVKCRAQFGIRSGPKQITAYFNDMGSATFDVLSSPTSLPIGRVQVPGVASLSSSSPIRGRYPIMSASSRKLGELQISMSFKQLKAAYEETSDTMTDGSYSARSRTSLGGYGSRQSSRSRASSVDSIKSRSSSRGSSAGKRSRSNSRSKSGSKRTNEKRRSLQVRSRSRSTESRASLDASKNEVPTPRGVDALLEQNGHDLYGEEGAGVRRTKKEKQVVIKTTVSMTRPTESSHADAISELLKRGRKLREEINQSGIQNPPNSPPRSQFVDPNQPLQQTVYRPQQDHHPPAIMTTTVATTVHTAPLTTTAATPAKSKKSGNPDLRILDMVFKAKGMKNIDFATPDASTLGSSHCSLVSDLDDPLHDESILQHLFYNETNGMTSRRARHASEQIERIKTDNQGPERSLRNSQKAPNQPPDQTRIKEVTWEGSELTNLDSVTGVRVTIHGLQLASHPGSDDEPRRKGKPPMSASPARTSGRTYFVEYKFPRTISSHRSIAVTSSSQELTRVASRKISKAGMVKFDQQSLFNIRFNAATISKWTSDNLELVVYEKRPKQKKASILGVATLPLNRVVNSARPSHTEHLDVKPKTSDSLFNTKVHGTLKVSIDLLDDVKNIQARVANTVPESVDAPNPDPPASLRSAKTETNKNRVETAVSQRPEVGDSTRVCVDDMSRDASGDADVCPRIASTVLYLYILLDRAKNIPATKLQSGPDSGKSSAPNVYLVCRTFASDEASTTPVAWSSSDPKFGFTQVIPVKINKHLFERLRNNYMVVEVWTKVTSDRKLSDKLMGLVKIPLQLFHQSLKDSDVARAVLKSDYPLVSVDGYQSIVDVFSGHERGQLKLLLALGTEMQVNALRKLKGSDELTHHLDEKNGDKDEIGDGSGSLTHVFEITVHRLRGFEPHQTQVWGETDCFVQYYFPSHEPEDGNESTTSGANDDDGVSLQRYRSPTTLCIPNPQFNFTKRHAFDPRPSVPIPNILHSSFPRSGKSPGGVGVTFEVWSRFYYPNVRDQLLAKGSLPLAKLTALVTMSNKKTVEQTFQVPLHFVDAERGPRAAGEVQISIKYKSPTASKVGATQTNLAFQRNIKLQVAVLRGCGLKSVAKLQASLFDDANLQYCSEVGVNSYVKVKASFLPTEKPRETRCVARSFAPDYNHHFEFDCPVLSYVDDDTPTSFAAQLASGEIILEVWHRPVIEDIEGKFKASEDVLLGRIQVPTCKLLYKTTGFSGWHSITSIESLQHKSSSNVGAVELALSLSCRSDLELVLRAAKSLAWSPALKSDLNRLLVPSSSGTLKPIEEADCTEDSLTCCITITNAWLPRKLLSHPGSDEISKHAHIYLRYKFYDKDTVVSSICPVASAGDRKTFKQHDVFPVKLAHRKSFLCRTTQPLVWYLREESMEVQVWFSYSRSSRTRKRPFDSDRLLGTSFIDMSSVLVDGLHRQQHISGLYPLFKAGADDLGDASIRVYFSLSPGDQTKPFERENLDDTSGTLSSSTDVSTPSKSSIAGERPRRKTSRAQLDHFAAIVSIERAMHLASLPVSSQDARPSCYVTYPVIDGDKNVEATRVVSRSSCPVWNDAKEVKLDRKVLDKEAGGLLFRVWQRDGEEGSADGEGQSRETSDKVIGFATVDVSLLLAGFRAVNGWYNVLDIHGNCQGQIKVAITPTDPLYVANKLTPEGPSMGVKPPSPPTSPHRGIMHSVPLLEPVQTPSGSSVYYPGVSSARKAANQKNSPANDDPESSTVLPSGPSLSTVNIDAIPRRALFQHDAHSTLQSALQRQIKELDQIKETFRKRLAHPRSVDGPTPVFTPTTTTTTTATLTQIYQQFPSFPPKTLASELTLLSSAQSSTGSSTRTESESFNPVPSGAVLQKPTAEVANERTQVEPSSSTPESVRTKPTVHLSLFKPAKSTTTDLDGAALSDNDLSDVEFVQPVNLNDGELPHGDHVVAPSHPDDEEDRESSVSFNVSPQATGSSEVVELNNTSLWLSASSSQLENANKTSASGSDDRDLATVVDPDLPAGSTDPGEDSTDLARELEAKDGEDSCENREQVDLESQPRSQLGDEVLEDAIDVLASNSDPDDGGEDDSDATVKNEEEEDFAIETDFLLVNEERSDEMKTEEDVDDLPVTHNHHTDPPSQDEDEIPLCNRAYSDDEEDSKLKPINLNKAPGSEDKTSNVGANVDEHEKPSSSSMKPRTAAPPSTSWTHIPSFFPPRQDLLESMKALQAITTEQKRKLQRQEEEAEDKENSSHTRKSPVLSKPRRTLLKPASRTSEQTERLARIFSTKYS